VLAAPGRHVPADSTPATDGRNRLAVWLLHQLGQKTISDAMLLHLMVGVLLLTMMQGGPTIGGLLRVAFAAGRLYGQITERAKQGRGR
jgi:hypothetical protein